MSWRIGTWFWVGVVFMAALGLYSVKYKVQSLHEQVEDVAKQIRDEREAMHVLSAEWAYLTRSERLSALAKKHLGMNALPAAAIADVAALPPALQSGQDGPVLAEAPTAGAQANEIPASVALPAEGLQPLQPLPSLLLTGGGHE